MKLKLLQNKQICATAFAMTFLTLPSLQQTSLVEETTPAALAISDTAVQAQQARTPESEWMPKGVVKKYLL